VGTSGSGVDQEKADSGFDLEHEWGFFLELTEGSHQQVVPTVGPTCQCRQLPMKSCREGIGGERCLDYGGRF
jgi:hypothetical protein